MNRNISEIIESRLNKDCLNMGFYSGRAGELFLYSHCKSQKAVLFDSALQKIVDSVYGMTHFSFSDGLTGIGFVLQYLFNRNYLSSQYEKVLKYLDDRIYNNVANKKSTSLSLLSENSALAQAIYFYHRINTYKGIDSSYRNLANRECLVLLVTEIKDLLSVIVNNQDMLLPKRPVFYLEIGQCFVFLYRLLMINMNKKSCQDLLLMIRNFIYDCFENKDILNSENRIFIFRLLYFYAYVSFEIKDAFMKDCSAKWIRKYVSVFSNSIESNVDTYMLSLLGKMYSINVNCRYIHTLDDFPRGYWGYFLWNGYCEKDLLELIN